MASEPTPTLTKEQMIMAGAGASYGDNFHFSCVDCEQAVASGSQSECVFPAGMEVITRPEWAELFPGAVFYEVHLVGGVLRKTCLRIRIKTGACVVISWPSKLGRSTRSGNMTVCWDAMMYALQKLILNALPES